MLANRSSFSTACDQQHETGDQRDGSDDGRDGDGVSLVCRDLNGTQVNGLLPGRASETLVGESNDADGNEQDSENGLWFHETGRSRYLELQV